MAPPRPFVNHERRWRAFVSEIEQRIATLREHEGIDGRTEPWQTFDPPLPRRPSAPSRPVRLRLAPVPTLDRDTRGRLLPRRQIAS